MILRKTPLKVYSNIKLSEFISKIESCISPLTSGHPHKETALVFCIFNIILKLINYSYCYQPTRTPHSGQVDEFRNPMKKELKTTRV